MKASKACNELQYTSHVDSSDSSSSEIEVGKRARTRQPRIIFTPDEGRKRQKKTSNSQPLKKQKLFIEKSANLVLNSPVLETEGLAPIFSGILAQIYLHSIAI